MKLRQLCAVLVTTSILAISTSAIAAPLDPPASDAAPDAGQRPALAPDDAETKRIEDIIVTGTLVRGIAPPGASVTSVTRDNITASGATTVAQLLQTIPQLGSFGQLQQPLANSPEVSVNRPNLRNLPGFNTAGGSTTLVLLDGHRVVGMGNASTSPDPDIIPPGVIERVEIVPDGGSAMYGSDAVAGVLNFITIKRFDGLKVNGAYGFADHYYRYDINGVVGKDWGSGSIFLSYDYAKNDGLLGKDRSYIKQFPNANGLTSLQCSPGNIEAIAGAFGRPAGTVVGLPAGTATGPNQCDESDYATVFPAQRRHSVFAGLTQQLSDAISFEMRGFYTNRKTVVQNGPYVFSQLLVPQPYTAALQAAGVPAISSPFSTVGFGGFVGGVPVFVPNSPNTVDLVEQVDGQFGPTNARTARIELDTWGITPTFTADLGKTFQLRALGNYGESVADFTNATFNQTALQNAIVAGLFNPFDPASSNPAAVAAITDFQEYNRTRQYQYNFRATVDGDLFQLPGGAAKIAAGVEYLNETFKSQAGQTVPGYQNSGYASQSVNGTLIVPAGAGIPRFDVGRNVKSAFGELVLPVLGGDGRPSLNLSAAGRYDSYSDVGDTFNPRFGATFKPIPWISLRGAWGKSFNAPSLADQKDAGITTVYVLSGAAAAFYAPPASLIGTGAGKYPAYNGGLVVAIRGNAPGIKPQKATTWTVGFDAQPPIVPGLSFGATYYNIAFDNLIGLASFQTPSLLYRDYSNLITIAPSQAVLDAALASANVINGPSTAPAAGTYAFLDARKTNLGDFKMDGIDLRASYRGTTGFGAVFFNTNGTYELSREQSSTPGAAFVDVLSANANRFRIRSAAGVEVGPLLGQVTWNHLSGYKIDPTVGYVPQTHLSAFDTFDLFFRLKVPGSGLMQDLELTLNVDNVADQAPPQYRGGSQVAGQDGILYTNTLGRLVQFGLSKKF